MSMTDPLGWKEAELLNAIGDGADLFDRAACEVARGLESKGLAVVGPARAVPKGKGKKAPAPETLPHMSVKPTAKGRKASAAYFDRELGVRRWGVT